MTFTMLWVLWIGGFALIEGIALADKRRGDTLSEHIWRWFRVTDRRNTPLTWAARLPLYVALVWLAGHLAFGWWTL